MKLLKAEREVNKQEGGEEIKCYMIWHYDDGFDALKRAAHDRKIES